MHLEPGVIFMDTILDKLDLARYLNLRHKEIFNQEISPIKLQKSLYFLFAYWSKKASELQKQNSEVCIPHSLRLFESDFKAWAYGPVDNQVYGLFKNNNLGEMTSEEKNEWVKNQDRIVIDYIETGISEYFNVSDFTLVDISHSDEAWSKNFNALVEKSNKPIPEEQIISEYTGDSFE